MGISRDQVHPDDRRTIDEEDLECVICRELVQKPTQCVICHNIFCSPCLVEWKRLNEKCPFKCSSNSIRHEPISPAKWAKYSAVRVQCSRGCQQYIPYLDYIDHISLCGLDKCPNHQFCGRFVKYLFEDVRSCSELCFSLIKERKSDEEIRAALEAARTEVSGPSLSKFSVQFDPEFSSKSFTFVQPNQLTSSSSERKYHTALSKVGFLGGIHCIRFEVSKAQEHFKVGVSAKRGFDIETTAFSDLEGGFAFYSRGQTRNNNPRSGLPFLLPLIPDADNVIDMHLSMGDGKLSFATKGLEDLAFHDDRLKEGPLYVAVAFAEKVQSVEISNTDNMM